MSDLVAGLLLLMGSTALNCWSNITYYLPHMFDLFCLCIRTWNFDNIKSIIEFANLFKINKAGLNSEKLTSQFNSFQDTPFLSNSIHRNFPYSYYDYLFCHLRSLASVNKSSIDGYSLFWLLVSPHVPYRFPWIVFELTIIRLEQKYMDICYVCPVWAVSIDFLFYGQLGGLRNNNSDQRWSEVRSRKVTAIK